MPENRHFSSLTIATVLLNTFLFIQPNVAQSPAKVHGATAQQGPVRMPADFASEAARVEAQVDEIEATTLTQVGVTAQDQQGRIRTLGKLFLFDKHLSVRQNEACSFCHSQATGFTGPIQSLNETTVSYPGSVRTRFSQRKPQSYMYAAFAPPLHYDAIRGDFVGGNFWDMRASGYRLQSPSAEQAQSPPTNPVEMGLPDSACLAYRISQAPYRKIFEQAWGADLLTITWPANIEHICSTPGPASDKDPLPVHLNAADRSRADRVFDDFGLSIAAYEISPEISPFSSKFDYVLAGRDKFTDQEARGYALFRSKGRCNECHRDGGPGEEPLFTDYTASNLGVPANHSLAYYLEAMPDQQGYTPNPQGKGYTDKGVGAFLRKEKGLDGKTSPNDTWLPLANAYDGQFRTPTLRNVDMRPDPSFVKAYMHNGYFKSLKEVVHFYNTRDTLPVCKPGDPGEKVTCWPAPEYPQNVNRKQMGNLQLTDDEEDDIVAFMKTLTDSYSGQYQWVWTGGDPPPNSTGRDPKPYKQRWDLPFRTSPERWKN